MKTLQVHDGAVKMISNFIFFCREDTFPIVDWVGDESTPQYLKKANI